MGGKEQSEMIRSINLIVKWVGIVLFRLGLYCSGRAFCEWRVYHKERYIDSCSDYRNDTGGLVSADHSALALSTMKLARKKVLLHDMKVLRRLRVWMCFVWIKRAQLLSLI